MKKLHAIAGVLDNILYIFASVGMFAAAFNDSMIWVCVCGFILVDEGLSFIHRELTKEANAD